MRPFAVRVIRFSLFLGLFAGLLSCNPSSCNPVTPANTSPGALDVKIDFVDEPTTSDGKNLVAIQFLSGGSVVQFGNGETVSCNGVMLTYNGLVFAYAGRVPIQPVGGAYTFVYTRSGVNTTVALSVPPRPVFTSPASGATVARSNSLTIQYVAGMGTGVDAGASDGSTGIQRNVYEPDNGTYTGLDVSSLHVGTGTLSLTRKFDNMPSGTGFHSVQTTYRSVGNIAVVWS